MAVANQNTGIMNSSQASPMAQNPSNQQASESPFKRSPSPEPLTLPATTFKPPSNLEKPPLKRPLSLEVPAGPEITISHASSPESSEYSLLKRSATSDAEVKLAESAFGKPV